MVVVAPRLPVASVRTQRLHSQCIRQAPRQRGCKRWVERQALLRLTPIARDHDHVSTHQIRHPRSLSTPPWTPPPLRCRA